MKKREGVFKLTPSEILEVRNGVDILKYGAVPTNKELEKALMIASMEQKIAEDQSAIATMERDVLQRKTAIRAARYTLTRLIESI